MRVRFVERVPSADPEVSGDRLTIVCPWLKGLDGEAGIWLSALPIHDLNAFLELAPRDAAQQDDGEPTYLGVFALDRFRSQADLFSLMRSGGIKRIINVPSVSFFDGRSASTFQSLSLGCEQELAFLRAAKNAGFGVAFCGRRPLTGAAAAEPGLFDFILSHDGPRSEFRLEGSVAIG